MDMLNITYVKMANVLFVMFVVWLGFRHTNHLIRDRKKRSHVVKILLQTRLENILTVAKILCLVS